ncbi:ATP-binding protein [Streptomyces sp. SID5473]|uniref:ATP-binding protein n=2 Tax=Streptomyces TaxID=1883 RepID=A0A7G3UDK4_STRT9|nr:ATP-binding protein [Streptomyces sp. SID5473]QKM67419.1 ATP-binding protein [Streptomyces tsukubensis NRRL18488]TAI42124.1 ATP-binding protein [Streptomyces tsukubensis]
MGPLTYAAATLRNVQFRGPYSAGKATESALSSHDGGMAGLEGAEQPRQRDGVTAIRWMTAIEDEQGLKALELFGDPSLEEVRLPSRPESAATARRLTHSVIVRQWTLPAQTAESAVLLVSELVGNAVRHTGARVFGLRMTRRPGWIRVEVRDPSRGLPCLLPVQPMDISGRGLFLVDKLSDRWGVDLLPRGKTTWFEMRIPHPGSR